MICIPVIILHKSYGNFRDHVTEIKIFHSLFFVCKSVTYLIWESLYDLSSKVEVSVYGSANVYLKCLMLR